MEDGNCRQSQKDNIIPQLSGYDTQLPGKRYDNNYVNGNSDGLHKFHKKLLSNQDIIFTKGDKSSRFTDGIQEFKLKNTHKSENNSFIDANNSIGSLKKTLTKHPSKVTSFKSALLKNKTESCFKANENGNHKYLDGLPAERLLKDPNFLNNRKLALRHVHRQQALKKKHLQKSGKHNAAYQTEYAQYLGLQPTVKFKCSKCCCTSFESLGMLKEHQRSCSSQPSPHPAAPERVPPSSAGAPASPSNKTNFRITRKVYLCSACGTYYENWNLFLHIREVHNRHICLFCLGMFSQAHKLASHLAVKHNVREGEFASKEDFFAEYSDSFYLMCCKCENVFTERENFISHECAQAIKQCSGCKLRGGHRSDCPKSSKHRPSATQSQADGKKIRKSPIEKKYSDGPTLPNNIAKTVSADNPRVPIDLPTSSTLPISNETELRECEGRLAAGTPVGSLPSDLLDPSVPDRGPDSTVDRRGEDAERSPVALPELERPDSFNLLPGNHIEMDPQITSLPEPIPRVLLDSEVSPEDNGGSLGNVSEVLSHPRHSLEFTKIALKPPPRNRRPPKRYRFRDGRVETNQLEVTPEDPPVAEAPNIEVVNRVPKLTVKVPKMFIDKESTSDCSSESEDSDKLTVDVDADIRSDPRPVDDGAETDCDSAIDTGDHISANDVSKNADGPTDAEAPVAGEDVPLTELTLDRPLEPYPLGGLLKVFLSATVYHCIYCNHARKIAVNGEQLGLHFMAQHRFSATVDSITAEELLPETIALKIRSCLPDVRSVFLNMNGYDSAETAAAENYDHTYECFQCYFVTTVHKELYLHNRKMHQKTILLCVMCKSNFYSYSELLCHLCPGAYVPGGLIRFRCCLCRLDSIPSAFRLMVHLRKTHHACDVCLETCHSQAKLSNHVWKHKLHHLCYRCGIAYRNKPDITKHLYWKHGTQSVLCKRCLQKKWPHVYHFCVPPVSFACEECNSNFTRAVRLRVHRRLHTGDRPHPCREENCSEAFISGRLLARHALVHSEPLAPPEPPSNAILIADDNVENLPHLPPESDIEPAVAVKLETKAAVKLKKSKKSKKNAAGDDLLIDVNLPELNLSESDSSDGSEPEVSRSKKETFDVLLAEPERPPDPDDAEPEPPVAGIWDNFKMYQAKIEKKEDKSIENAAPRHVCESDHDYCVIPPVLDVVDQDDAKAPIVVPEGEGDPSKGKKRTKTKKRSTGKERSSSSDSSSRSDSSCSCRTDCSCSSSGGSSSSASSSSGSALSGAPRRRRRAGARRKDSDASRISAVDVVATEESPPALAPEPAEAPIAESDLDTDETETDEDFYDEHPQRAVGEVITDGRDRPALPVIDTPEVPVDVPCAGRSDTGEPSAPPEPRKRLKKKMKTKKKKKDKRGEPPRERESAPRTDFAPVGGSIPEDEANMKITISLQTNTVQVYEVPPGAAPAKSGAGVRGGSDAESKRASKRRRVPNRFYGYSSDEEYALKPHLPPKLEWRKEDLPSPSTGSQRAASPPRAPRVPDIAPHRPTPIILPEPALEPPPQPSGDDSDSSGEGALQINFPPFRATERDERVVGRFSGVPRPAVGGFPFPRPAGARQAREGESVYCYCRCPYDEVSEMIACDADGCSIEWFHFECVGIYVPPKGKWYCPDCSLRLGIVSA